MLLTTGEVSNINVEQLIHNLIDTGMHVGESIIGAIILYVIGRFIIKWVNRLVAKVLEKRKLEISVQTFLKSLVSILLNLILAFAIVSKLGVETTSFAAILASAGVAIGMALSGNLSNFAGGLIILVFKPFKVGDVIEAQGVCGGVKEILIFHTILSTPDNRIIYIPNGALSSNTIINLSKEDIRRAEWNFGVEYGEDFGRVKEVLERVIAADKRVLTTPAPFIALGNLSASSVDIKVRVWMKSADYWDVFFDMNKAVYEEFNQENIGFPFPQLTVHKAE